MGGWVGVGVGVGVYIFDNTRQDATNEVLKKNYSTLGCEDMRVGAAAAAVVLCCKKTDARGKRNMFFKIYIYIYLTTSRRRSRRP